MLGSKGIRPSRSAGIRPARYCLEPDDPDLPGYVHTLHPTHPTPHTPYTSHALHFTRLTPHTPYTSHALRFTQLETSHASHLTPHASPLTPHLAPYPSYVPMPADPKLPGYDHCLRLTHETHPPSVHPTAHTLHLATPYTSPSCLSNVGGRSSYARRRRVAPTRPTTARASPNTLSRRGPPSASTPSPPTPTTAAPPPPPPARAVRPGRPAARRARSGRPLLRLAARAWGSFARARSQICGERRIAGCLSAVQLLRL